LHGDADRTVPVTGPDLETILKRKKSPYEIKIFPK
jgi:hypothetical protein